VSFENSGFDRYNSETGRLAPSCEPGDLLNFELPDRRFEAADYLAWLYDDNPHGGGVYRSIDEGGRRVAHYALSYDRVAWLLKTGPESGPVSEIDQRPPLADDR